MLILRSEAMCRITGTHVAYQGGFHVNGWTYAAVGNFLNNGIIRPACAILHRLTSQGGMSYRSAGDGVLVAHTSSGATTPYTQDLVAPLSQVLQLTHGLQRTDDVYGHERRLALEGTARTVDQKRASSSRSSIKLTCQGQSAMCVGWRRSALSSVEHTVA